MPDIYLTPLWRKFAIPDGGRFVVHGEPGAVLGDLEGLPEGVVRLPEPDGELVDVVLGFARTRAELLEILDLRSALTEAGGLWVIWPKKSSALQSDIDFTMVQTTGLSTGLVDNKTCRVDADWQAMRFVKRVVDRARR